MKLQRILCVFLLVFSPLSMASMLVQQSILQFRVGDPSRMDVEVKNPDLEPLYVQVEVHEIVKAGEEGEQRVLVTNPKESGFLVTPNRLVIQPGAAKNIRLVNLKALGDKERVFRVTLKPVAADVEAEQTGVKILVGYQLLVLVSPNAPKANLHVKRTGKRLELFNDGNTNVLLSRGKQCQVAATEKTEASNCEELVSKRVYPGNTAVYELKYDTPVEFLYTTGTFNQSVVY